MHLLSPLIPKQSGAATNIPVSPPLPLATSPLGMHRAVHRGALVPSHPVLCNLVSSQAKYSLSECLPPSMWRYVKPLPTPIHSLLPTTVLFSTFYLPNMQTSAKFQHPSSSFFCISLSLTYSGDLTKISLFHKNPSTLDSTSIQRCK